MSLWSLITSDFAENEAYEFQNYTLTAKVHECWFPATLTNIKWSYKDELFSPVKLYETVPAVAASSVSAPLWILSHSDARNGFTEYQKINNFKIVFNIV